MSVHGPAETKTGRRSLSAATSTPTGPPTITRRGDSGPGVGSGGTGRGGRCVSVSLRGKQQRGNVDKVNACGSAEMKSILVSTFIPHKNFGLIKNFQGFTDYVPTVYEGS